MGAGIIVIPVHRGAPWEANGCAQGHTAGKWQVEALCEVTLTPGFMSLTALPQARNMGQYS